MTEPLINLTQLRELAMRARCGGRSEKYQRDGEWASFPADDVLVLIDTAEAAMGLAMEHTLEIDTDPNSAADFTGNHTPECKGCRLRETLARFTTE